MIDLHCHLLPGIDDGANDIGVSLAMARMAVADGIFTVACTPHITPGVYANTGPQIARAVADLSRALEEAEIPLHLTTGADVHISPDMVDGLKTGRIPTIGGSRYFLLEPPHHVPPPRLEEFVFNVMTAGYLPVITHPERLSWIDAYYPLLCRLVQQGALVQLTAGAVTGQFGGRVQRWAERMLDDDIVHIVATDAHSATRRPPILSEARDRIGRRWGEDRAEAMVVANPLGILENVLLSSGSYTTASGMAGAPVERRSSGRGN